SPWLAQQLLLPIPGRAHDRVEIVQARLPAELRADSVGTGDEGRRIAGAAPSLMHLQPATGDPLHAREHLPYAVAVTVADVERGRGATATQPGERIAVRCGEILDVNVIADAGAICRRIVGAEDLDRVAFPCGRFAGHLDEECRIWGCLSNAAARVGAGHIEVAQHRIP